MEWIICFCVSLGILALTVILFILSMIFKNKQGRAFNGLNMLLAGSFVAAFVLVIPVFMNMLDDIKLKGIEVLIYSFHTAFQMFTGNTDSGLIIDNIADATGGIGTAYSFYMSILLAVSPILTFSFLISFFKNAVAYVKYVLHFFSDVYVFSELNEKSFELASDIKNNHKKAMIVFTNVFEQTEDTQRAHKIGAVCFRKDIFDINLKNHFIRSKQTFFVIGENQTENLNRALKLISIYGDMENTNLYVFSTDVSSELLLSNANQGKIKIRRINEVRSLITCILYEEGNKLFENAVKISKTEKEITAAIVGMGRHGTEMTKALAWYCQMDGYRLTVKAFDKDKRAEDKFKALCPELMSEEYNGVYIPEEAYYSIKVYSDIDVDTKTFADEIMKFKTASYVLVALGSDELNIRTAVNLRMLFERVGAKPVIQAIVYSSEAADALNGITNYRGQSYDIDFIGDISHTYSEKVIMDFDVENDALARHLKWGSEEEFWRYEYNYRSSIASALHMKARQLCNIAGANKAEKELTEAERDTIEKLEHRRWNAYVRSEGYVYSGSPNSESRNDLAKMHHNLVDFSTLSEEDKRKDSRVGTK